MSARWVILSYLVAIVLLHVFPTNSVVPSDQRIWNGFELDYLVHIILFFPWMALLSLSTQGIRDNSAATSGFFWNWLVIGVIVAAGAEGLQYFLVYRVFNPIDLGLNVSGVLLGAVFFYLWKGPHSFWLDPKEPNDPGPDVSGQAMK